MFIMSLAVADLTVGMIVMPVSSAYAITGDWRLGLVLCQFWLAADYTASTASILNLLILSLDRYWSIRHPLKYLRKRTKKRAIVMIAIVWLVSSLWIVPIIGWHYWFSGGVRKQPNNVCETEFADNVLFKLTVSIINFYAPMFLMMGLYAKIFYEIKKRSKMEIGQCNMLGPSSSGSTYDVSVRGDGKTIGLSRNSSKSSIGSNRIDEKPNKSGGAPRQYIYADYRSHNHVHHHSQMEQPTERRYNRLTLLTVKPGASPSPSRSNQESEPDGSASDSQYFPGITVNIEYVEEEGSEPNSDELATAGPSRGNSLTAAKSYQRTKCAPPRRRSSAVTQSKSLVTWLCPCANNGNRAGQRSPGDSPLDCGSGSSSKTKSAVRMADYDNGGETQCRRTGSATSRRLNNNLNALRMRVTRKNFSCNLRQEKKAARQLGVIMGAFILCWLPYIIIFIVTACCQKCVSSPVHTASIWLGYLNSAMNPFLYALCNRNFKRAFKKMFRRGSKSRLFLPPCHNAARTEQLFA